MSLRTFAYPVWPSLCSTFMWALWPWSVLHCSAEELLGTCEFCSWNAAPAIKGLACFYLIYIPLKVNTKTKVMSVCFIKMKLLKIIYLFSFYFFSNMATRKIYTAFLNLYHLSGIYVCECACIYICICIYDNDSPDKLLQISVYIQQKLLITSCHPFCRYFFFFLFKDLKLL